MISIRNNVQQRVSAALPAPANAVYGVGAATPPAPEKLAQPTADFDTVEKVEAALSAGTISVRQAAAYRAWITMRSRPKMAKETKPKIVIRDRSQPRDVNPAWIDAVAAERPTFKVVRGTVIGYREAWGGHRGRPVIQRLWYVQPEGTSAKRDRVHLNTTCWHLEHHLDTLPCIGERVEIVVHGQIGSKIRAQSWKTIGDPVDDVLAGRASEYLRVEPGPYGAKQLVFTVAHDKLVKGKHRAHGKSMPKDHLYSAEFMRRFGTALIKRHEPRLTEFDHVVIGRARFDTSGRLHCSYGSAIPGRFFWHGQAIQYDLNAVDPETGLFRSAADAVRFDTSGRRSHS